MCYLGVKIDAVRALNSVYTSTTRRFRMAWLKAQKEMYDHAMQYHVNTS